jgi:hypothetical protein
VCCQGEDSVQRLPRLAVVIGSNPGLATTYTELDSFGSVNVRVALGTGHCCEAPFGPLGAADIRRTATRHEKEEAPTGGTGLLRVPLGEQ